ncbi:MAG: hypothetical protein KC593_02390 [Myxococcales bacterium]|nr:hypothetical protein [Myxococcales bacterium]MCB9625841.1 hypothetical protein [Sandaracinaceae bacterium]
MYRHPALTSRSVSLLGATLVALLAGCTSWEELPAGATGFLVVDRATLTGTVNGEQVVPGSTRASGYCISGGWRLELRADTEAGDEVTHVIEVLDLDMRERDATVQFVRQGPALLVEDAREAGQLKLWTCVGDETAPEFEQEATDVTLDLSTNDQGDIEVAYTATFDSGDEMQAQFEMEMPIVD